MIPQNQVQPHGSICTTTVLSRITSISQHVKTTGSMLPSVQCSGCMSNRQSTVGVYRANIGDQSRACETRSCLFLYACSGVYICTDIHTQCSTHCIVSVLLIKISELYIISKSHGDMCIKQTIYIISYYSRLCTTTTTTAVSTQVSKGQISAIEVGRAKQGCACFCTLASESTSVLIYVLIKVHTVLFLYHF